MEKKWIKNPQYELDEISRNFAFSQGCLSENTVFCFKHIDNKYDADNLCSNKIANKLQKAFIRKIQKISQLTYGQVQEDDKRGNGYETLEVNILKRNIPRSVTEDVEKVNVFRFGEKGRIVGFYNRNIFHILFIDPHLKLYDHGR